jgi:Ca-activated chloride channel homolog
MTFLQPWALLLLVVPAAWAAWEWSASARRAALLLKAAALAAIVLALAQPRLVVYTSKVAVALLADTSASMTALDLRTESALARQVERVRGRHSMRVIPFAGVSRNASADEHPKGVWQLRHTAGSAGRATNLESAIRDGAASLPAGMVPRLLLVSDGNENLGSAARAIWQAQQLGIPVDTVPLAGQPKPGLLLESVAIPGQVFSGERFPIEVTIEAPRATGAAVELSAEGKPIANSSVELVPGPNHLRLQTSINSAGAIALAGRVSAPGLGAARFEDAVTLRRPRVLLVSRDPAASQEHLVRALSVNQFDVVQSPAGIPDKLDDFQLAVVNNWDMDSIPPSRKAALETFVKNGGGLVWIAGERNVYRAKREQDPLDRVLPARLAPPRSPEGTAVVLIIDKSSSMEGRKIELARLAAIGVVQNLRPIDEVGVLIFDNSYQWAVPLRRADDLPAIERLISGIAPDGGTQIAPALTEAYQRILPVNAIYKHIVLLTDGISEEGDSMALARQALARHITISTVGLGQDVNRAFLDRVAQSAEGKSYFLNDPSGLEQLLLRDVEEHTGATAVEKSIVPRIVKRAEILDGVGIETAPPLRGYVRFETRPTAETILDADRGDPLFVRWQYGLGRAAVFTSDAKNRWAVNWVTWAGFDRLWANIFRDLLPHAQPTEAAAEFDRAGNELVVDYLMGRNVPDPGAGGAPLPDVFAFGPNGFQARLTVNKVAAGHYRGRLAIGQNQGLFRVRPLEDSRAFPEVGFYRQEEEMLAYGNDEPLLRRIAASTGGRFNPAPAQVFDAGGRSIRDSMDLWPGLLALAVLLNLAELILRKWKGVVDALHLRRSLLRLDRNHPQVGVSEVHADVR